MDVVFICLLGATFLAVMFTGYPIAFVLGGVSVAFAALGTVLDSFAVTDADMASLRMIGFVANRIFDSLSSYSLIPMSMFIFMGLMLDKSGAAERLLTQMHKVLRSVPGGMAIAVVVIGVVLAASTGIIGASVVLLATIAMPAMRAAGYDDRLGLGVIGATGCLGILIPPSIMLIVMGDQLQIPVGDLFRGAMLPGLLLAFETRTSLYMPAIFNALAMAAILAAGVGLTNAYLFLAFPAWERIWQVATRPLFIMSGVFFIFEDVPQDVRYFLWFNPLFHVTGEMRRGFYPTYAADYVAPGFVVALGLGLALFGMLLLSRHADGLVHK